MKPKIKFIIDALMFLIMAAIAGIGLLIKYVLIPGQDRWVKYGRNVDLQMFGVDRHEWGKIHLLLGYVLIGLLIIHIIIHWKAIICLIQCTIKWTFARRLSVLFFVFICVGLLAFPFIFKPEILEIEQGKGHHSIIQNDKTRETEMYLHSDTISNITQEKINEKLKTNTALDVKGSMTLEEISNKYNIPSSYIKTQLNIPASIPDKQKLGQLRKQYGFSMHDIEVIIANYKNK